MYVGYNQEFVNCGFLCFKVQLLVVSEHVMVLSI